MNWIELTKEHDGSKFLINHAHIVSFEMKDGELRVYSSAGNDYWSVRESYAQVKAKLEAAEREELRATLAGMAMEGYWSAHEDDRDLNFGRITQNAIEQADALMAELGKPGADDGEIAAQRRNIEWLDKHALELERLRDAMALIREVHRRQNGYTPQVELTVSSKQIINKAIAIADGCGEGGER